MTHLFVPLVAAGVAGVAVALLWWLLVPRLPEPVTDEPKVPYARVRTFRAGLVVVAYGAAGAWVSSTLVPVSMLPPWMVLSTLGVCLAAIDAFTTWLPARLTRSTWMVLAAAVAVMVVCGAGWSDVVRTVAGAVLAGVVYYLLWRATNRGFGFGDVRYVPIVAAATAASGWSTWVTSLIAGSLLVLGHGIWHRARRQEGLLPWAPGLTLGAYLALIITR